MGVFDKVRKILVEQLDAPGEMIELDTSLDELGSDSLKVVLVEIALEQEFNIEIPDKDSANWHTVKDIITTVHLLI